MTSEPDHSHLVSLPGTEWTAWRDAVLRSTGFPADGLDRFADPACAAVADAFLDGRASAADLAAALETAQAQSHRTAAEIVTDPLFREAVTWQNPDMLEFLTNGMRKVPATSREKHKQRTRQNTIARYWQRYCGKNDTIGFFGPVTWVTLDPDAPGVEVRCGEGLVRARSAYFEFWALDTFAMQVAADPVVRPWLPAGLHPHLTVDGDRVLRPGAEPLELTPGEAALLARCDGHRPARDIAAGAGGLALLEGLAARGVIWWGVDLPQNPQAVTALRSALAAIPDPAARERAQSGLRRLDAALDAVSLAAGDADKLAAAVSALDTEFTSLTGAEAARRPGRMYAGRRLCYEETLRDVEITLGRPVLEALAGPLDRLLMPASRWLSMTLAQAYTGAFRSIFGELGGTAAPGGGVPLDRFWAAALPLFDDGHPISEGIAAEFSLRWRALFGLDGLAPGTRRVTVASADIAGRVAELFAADRPGWPAARIHSPDLHICAASPEALADGDFTMVLGEMHAVWAALDCVVFTDRHPDQDRLRAAAAADMGRLLRPLFAGWNPHFTPRMATDLRDDYQLAFAPEPGADPDRLLPVMAMSVIEHDGALAVTTTKDGRRWPLLDVFAILMSWVGSELFGSASPSPHEPRVTVDQLVVARETWRTTAGASGLAESGQQAEYLAARQMRRSLGLPEKVYAKVSTETKPVYLDFTSPQYVSAFVNMVRSAQRKAGDGAEIVLTEMLPGPDQAWLPDAQGRHYFSELRMHVRDPMPAGGPRHEEEQ